MFIIFSLGISPGVPVTLSVGANCSNEIQKYVLEHDSFRVLSIQLVRQLNAQRKCTVTPHAGDIEVLGRGSNNDNCGLAAELKYVEDSNEAVLKVKVCPYSDPDVSWNSSIKLLVSREDAAQQIVILFRPIIMNVIQETTAAPTTTTTVPEDTTTTESVPGIDQVITDSQDARVETTHVTSGVGAVVIAILVVVIGVLGVCLYLCKLQNGKLVLNDEEKQMDGKTPPPLERSSSLPDLSAPSIGSTRYGTPSRNFSPNQTRRALVLDSPSDTPETS